MDPQPTTPPSRQPGQTHPSRNFPPAPLASASSSSGWAITSSTPGPLREHAWQMTSPGTSSTTRRYRRVRSGMAVTAEPEFDPACGTYISWSGGFSLPETFGALVRDDDLPWDIRLEVFVEQDGIAKCTSLTIEVPDGTTIDEAWEPVTPAGFRRVRLSACLEAACIAAAIAAHRAPDRAMHLARRKGAAPLPRPARPIRGRRTPDEFFRGVAHAYIEATKSTP